MKLQRGGEGVKNCPKLYYVIYEWPPRKKDTANWQVKMVLKRGTIKEFEKLFVRAGVKPCLGGLFTVQIENIISSYTKKFYLLFVDLGFESILSG